MTRKGTLLVSVSLLAILLFVTGCAPNFSKGTDKNYYHTITKIIHTDDNLNIHKNINNSIRKTYEGYLFQVKNKWPWYITENMYKKNIKI